MAGNLNYEGEDVKGRNVIARGVVCTNQTGVAPAGGATALLAGNAIPIVIANPSTAPLPVGGVPLGNAMLCYAYNAGTFRLYVYDDASGGGTAGWRYVALT